MASRLVLVGSPSGEARSGMPLDAQPVVQLQDAAGSPVRVAGVTVNVSVSGGGTLSGNSAVTGTEGRAVFSALTLRGAAGTKTVSFAATGLTAATHTLTLKAGPAARMANHPATSQVAIIGAEVPVLPAVLVTDADLNPVPDVPVAFAVSAGHGTIQGENATTGTDGIAAVRSWAIPPAVGTYQLTASSPGLTGSPVTFQAQGVTRMPSVILVHAGQGQTATANTDVATPPAVRITSNSLPALGIPVTFTVTSGGGSITGPEQTTDANGIARLGSWTLGAVGPNTLSAAIPGSPLAPVTISATAIGIGNVVADPIPPRQLTGAALHPRVRVTAPGGVPLAGIPVSFAVAAGGGSVSDGAQTTDGEGYAAPTAWTLGTEPGIQQLTVTAPAGYGNSPLTLQVRAYAKLATRAEIHAGNGQTGVVGQPLPIDPAVRLTADDGSPVPAWPITFQGGIGDGTITGGETVTDENGVATVGSWTLHVIPGRNHIFVNSPSGTITFFADAVAGPPSRMEVVPAAPPDGIVNGSPFYMPSARVTDALGNGIPGVPVTFTIAGGGGSLTGSNQVTDETGHARPTTWTLGTRPGMNLVTANAPSVPASASLIANALAGPVARILAVAGDGQSAGIGQRVPIDPRIEVRDEFDNPVAGALIQFTPIAGGGSVSAVDGQIATAPNGMAATGWTLGLAGTNRLRAAVVANPELSVTFTATAVQSGDPYDIEVRYLTTPSVSLQNAVQNAVNRWTGIIVNGLPSQAVSLPSGTCFTAPAVNETIEDLVIFVEVMAIDGVGGILGGATACAVRSGGLPAVGFMRFDVADVADLAASGELGDVMLHEIGHVLGFGTLWPSFGLLAFGPEPYFTGGHALQSYRDLGGTTAHGPGVPVENTGGQGTANAHWRETVFGNELMTGYILGSDNRLTSITISSLRDMGYQVSYTLAEPLGTPLSLRRDGAANARQIREIPLGGSIFVFDESGGVKTTIPRVR